LDHCFVTTHSIHKEGDLQNYSGVIFHETDVGTGPRLDLQDLQTIMLTTLNLKTTRGWTLATRQQQLPNIHRRLRTRKLSELWIMTTGCQQVLYLLLHYMFLVHLLDLAQLTGESYPLI
jgi:hypothetical protein